jgi:hypothetical protein
MLEKLDVWKCESYVKTIIHILLFSQKRIPFQEEKNMKTAGTVLLFITIIQFTGCFDVLDSSTKTNETRDAFQEKTAAGSDSIIIGCMDSNYAEFDPQANVHSDDSCITYRIRVIHGNWNMIEISVERNVLSVAVYPDGPCTIELINSNGDIIFSINGSGRRQYLVNMKGKSGIYFIHVVTANAVFNGKFAFL